MATPIPENRVAFSLAEIAEATGGEVRAGHAQAVRGVTTDSRGDVVGKLFVALQGESFDGHDFVARAVGAGATAVLVSRDVPLDGDVAVIRVPSTLDALGHLARLHRRRWGGTLVAIGGSAGKTTTKTAVASVLEALMPGQVHAARGNLNNQIGVPMVLFGLEPAHKVAVVEIGTNQRGEVEKLAAVAEPDVALLTLIALEHAEGIGDLDAVEAEEGALLAALGPAAAAIGNVDNARVRRQLERSSAESKLGYGAAESADYRLLSREPHGSCGARLAIRRPGGGDTIEIGLCGLPGALAALAALAVADRVLGEPVDAGRAAAAIAGEPGRLTPLTLGDGTVVLDDSYNANPASVKSSVETAREIAEARGARLVLVIGEMRELGAASAGEHAALGRELGVGVAAALVLVGGDAELALQPARAGGLDAVFAPDAESAIEPVLERVRPGDVVLIKASRGVRAERIVDGLVQARGRAA